MLFHIKILQTVIKRHKSIKSALKLGKHLNTTQNSFRKHLHELGKMCQWLLNQNMAKLGQ